MDYCAWLKGLQSTRWYCLRWSRPLVGDVIVLRSGVQEALSAAETDLAESVTTSISLRVIHRQSKGYLRAADLGRWSVNAASRWVHLMTPVESCTEYDAGESRHRSAKGDRQTIKPRWCVYYFGWRLSTGNDTLGFTRTAYDCRADNNFFRPELDRLSIGR